MYLRSLILEGMYASHFTDVYTIGQLLVEFLKPVLTYADIFASRFDTEMLAHRWPKSVFPRNEIILDTGHTKRCTLL